MGENARAYVRENFLITRQLRNVLAILVAQLQGDRERLEVFVP